MVRLISVEVFSGKEKLYQYETTVKRWYDGSCREIDDNDYIAEKKITKVVMKRTSEGIVYVNHYDEKGRPRKYKEYVNGELTSSEIIGYGEDCFNFVSADFDYEYMNGRLEYSLKRFCGYPEIAVMASGEDNKSVCLCSVRACETGRCVSKSFNLNRIEALPAGRIKLSVVIRSHSGKVLKEIY